MECPKGSIVTTSETVLTSLKRAQEWCEEVKAEHLPVNIKKWKSLDGRLRVEARDRNNQLIGIRG